MKRAQQPAGGLELEIQCNALQGSLMVRKRMVRLADGRHITLTAFEREAGCTKKNWRCSITVSLTNEPLGHMLDDPSMNGAPWVHTKCLCDSEVLDIVCGCLV